MTKFVIAQTVISSVEDEYWRDTLSLLVGEHADKDVILEFAQDGRPRNEVARPQGFYGDAVAYPCESKSTFFEVDIDPEDIEKEVRLRARIQGIGGQVWPRRNLWKPVRRLLNWSVSKKELAALSAASSLKHTKEHAERLLEAL